MSLPLYLAFPLSASGEYLHDNESVASADSISQLKKALPSVGKYAIYNLIYTAETSLTTELGFPPSDGNIPF